MPRNSVQAARQRGQSNGPPLSRRKRKAAERAQDQQRRHDARQEGRAICRDAERGILPVE
jgi:hypothetical protein